MRTAGDASSLSRLRWALSRAIVALPYYQHTNAFMAAQARHKPAAVLND
ncbi:MAG: hypothetical protein ACRD29_26000 [Acidimicrobiales bacterium]